jgi:hypothetical protein
LNTYFSIIQVQGRLSQLKIVGPGLFNTLFKRKLCVRTNDEDKTKESKEKNTIHSTKLQWKALKERFFGFFKGITIP